MIVRTAAPAAAAACLLAAGIAIIAPSSPNNQQPLSSSTSRPSSLFADAFVVVPSAPPHERRYAHRLTKQRQRGGRAAANLPILLLGAASSEEAPLGDLAPPQPPDLDGDLYESAQTKLPWEVLVEKEDRPVLDLSGDDSSLALSEEAAAAAGAEVGAGADGSEAEGGDDDSSAVGAASSSWEDGEHWAATRLRLVDLWVLPRDPSNGADANYANAATKAEEKMLRTVPQLLRLPPVQVVGAANAVLDAGLPPALLRSEPILLSFPPAYIEGGIEFLQTMMMAPSKAVVVAASKVTPGLLVGGVEGWIQEQTVKRALGEAGKATYGANQRIAGDVAQAFKAVKNKKMGGGG